MKEAEILSRIYPSVVTWSADWQKMVAAVRRFRLTEISLFLTGADIQERKKIYQALEKTSVRFIPHVHARHDMLKEHEFDYLIKRFGTKAFTMHFQYLKHFNNFKNRKKIFVENNGYQSKIRDLDVIKKFGGLAIDLSHLEINRRQVNNNFFIAQEGVEDYHYKIGCNHLSAVKASGRHWHGVENFSELEYVTNIPQKYFSPYICLELINPIRQQLVFRRQLARLLSKQWNQK